ncbi:MAG: hypothetical protein U9O98_01920 [Asgard group archaeon]|nr:hypothetical protein [Asgard group archaeon]
MSNRRGNNGNGRGRHRRMYELTGLPGWIRFGSSPGFSGGGRGMGPCGQYLQETGQMDEFVEKLTKDNPNYDQWQKVTDFESDTKKQSSYDFQPKNTDNRKQVIRDRINFLEEEIKQLKNELKNLR